MASEVPLGLRDLPPGLATDLAVLELAGSTIEKYEAHLLVRTADNPDFHRGNRLFVLDENAVADADRWVETFRLAFPDAGWIGIGLIRIPDDQSAWVAQGPAAEPIDVLSTRTPPRQQPLAKGYTVRRLRGGDWERSLARALAENDRAGREEPHSYERFARRRQAP